MVKDMRTREFASPEEWSERLREHGLRSTQGRIAALLHIERNPHSSPTDIYTALAEHFPSLSQQSVHNIANDLTEQGILRRVDLPESSSSLYELLQGNNHHHVQCIACRRIEDVDCEVREAPCL